MSRKISYHWVSDQPLRGQTHIEALLVRAQASGFVHEWGADSGWRALWLTGKPGAFLRTLRAVIDEHNPGARRGRSQEK